MADIGIDLGTTYSCVFHYGPNGQEVLIPASGGGELTPSAVYFDPDGSVQVGEAAKRMLRSDPDNLVTGIKRHMGEDYALEFHGHRYTPEAISALILKRLGLDAAAHFNTSPPKLRCVITVPAYFGVAEKEATHAAARIADLDCLELLAEPVAAAYAYGADPNVEESSLVFDLGGGTFDVAVVGMVNRQPRIWAVDGETQLGGLDWDRRLNDILWEQLVSQRIDEDAIFDERLTATLLNEAELLKRGLSGHDSRSTRVRFAGKTYTATVSTHDFETATGDLVAQCLDACQRVVATAKGFGAHDVSRVLLVGGSTRMPMIRKALETHLGLPALIHDPDKAVARGAAVLASRLLQPRVISAGTSGGLTRRITTVLPRAIGIKTYSSAPNPKPEPYVMNVLSANTPLPVAGKKITVATITPDQSSARIELFEQAGPMRSEELEANRLLYDGEVTGIPPAPAGSPIVLTVSVDIDGRINVSAADGRSGAPLTLEAFIHGVIDEQELGEQKANVATLLMAL